MPLIKIIDAHVVDRSHDKIADHLREVLKRIRMSKRNEGANSPPKLQKADSSDDPVGLDEDLDDEFDLSYKDECRIIDRAKRLLKARHVASGLSHLKQEEYGRLEPSLRGMQIVMPRGVDWADQVAANLHEEMPWLGPATEYLWHALRRAAQRGEPITLRPMILNGPPGIGKSVWARALATALYLPCADIDASKGGAGMALVGVERGWGTALAGRPIDLMLSNRIGNPLIIVDEICKARSLTSTQGSVFVFADALLSLLEPATARRWECPFFRVRFDMSYISWILTSNVVSNVPETVRNRCQIIEIPDVTIKQLHWFARKQGTKLGLSESSLEAVLSAISQAPVVTGRRQSLRDVVRMLERAEVLEGRPTLQ